MRILRRDRVELSKDQLIGIKQKVAKGEPIDKVLTSEFPNMTISIIRGYNNFSHEAYVQNAYFSKSEAKNDIFKIKLNEALCDTYHIVDGTIIDLNKGKIKDRKTKKPIDSIEIGMVYEDLEEQLLKSNN